MSFGTRLVVHASWKPLQLEAFSMGTDENATIQWEFDWSSETLNAEHHHSFTHWNVHLPTDSHAREFALQVPQEQSSPRNSFGRNQSRPRFCFSASAIAASQPAPTAMSIQSSFCCCTRHVQQNSIAPSNRLESPFRIFTFYKINAMRLCLLLCLQTGNLSLKTYLRQQHHFIPRTRKVIRSTNYCLAQMP